MKHRVLIVILAAMSMLGALSIDAYLPALPAIAQVFAVSLPAAQQTLTVYLIAFAFMTLFYGTLSDTFGRRPVVLIAMVIYLISSIGGGIAPSLGWLFFFRLLQGLSAGAGGVIGRAIVGDMMTGAEAHRTLSYISVVFGLAPAIAPILGGWLQAALGWRYIFFFIALFSFILLLASLRYLPESLPPAKRHPFQFKVIVYHYWEVVCHGRFMFAALGSALSFFGIMVYVASAPAFVINLLHLTVKDFAWMFLPLISGLTLGSFLSGRLSHRFSSDQTIAIGYAVMSVGALANLAYTLFFTAAIPWAVMPLFIYGMGASIGAPAMAILMLAMFPKVKGLTSSLQAFFFMAVFSFTSGVISPLLFGSAFRLAAGTATGLGLSIFSWWLSQRMRPRGDEDKISDETTEIEGEATPWS